MLSYREGSKFELDIVGASIPGTIHNNLVHRKASGSWLTSDADPSGN